MLQILGSYIKNDINCSIWTHQN